MAVQRSTMNWDKMVEIALETWQPGNNPMLHALMGLAGEAGEMIDQYKKHLYKDDYECSREEFLDELGDFWYYLRICCHLKGVSLLANHSLINRSNLRDNALGALVRILMYSSIMLGDYHIHKTDILQERFYNLYYCVLCRLNQLDCTIEELTKLNYDKLSDGKRGY